jgi:hypothetical protein
MYVETNGLGITITPGEGVEDITEQVRAGWKQPAPPSGPAAPSDKGDAAELPELPADLVPIDVPVEEAGAELEKTSGSDRTWYKSPWLWGGVVVLAVAGTLTAVYYRRRRTA